MPDAIVIGAGPNGLVAANELADRGWSVRVLEAAAEPGGGVATAPLTGDQDFRHDVCSAFYPFAVSSPVTRRLELERYGLRWRHAEYVVAHPAPDGTCPAISRDIEETAGILDQYEPGDGERWRGLMARWRRIEPGVLGVLTTPLPPVRAAAWLMAELRRDAIRYARFMLLPAQRMAEESLRGAAARRLLAVHVSHTDLSPIATPSGAFALVLAGLGQRHGYPAPEGGAGELTAALVRRLRERGGELVCGARVERIVVRGGRAAGVGVAGGGEHRAERAVIADVDAPTLYRELLPAEAVPARVRDDIARFEYDTPTVKVDWALDGPIPWSADRARRSAVLHVGSLAELVSASAEIANDRNPADPVLVMGQYAATDPTRSPPGTETAWAYTQVRRGFEDSEAEAFAERIEQRVEELAPGFRDLVRARHVLTPTGFERHDANLVRGSMHGGTTQLHQQGPFRPAPGLGRPETCVRGLYLGSASAHPGGGAHGGPGHNAARAALARDRLRPLSR